MKIFFIILFTIPMLNAVTLYYPNYEYTSTVLLKNYDAYYGNVNLFRFSIPNDVTLATWIFQIRSTAACPSMPVYVYLEYAGYPVISPLNETFPSTFNLNRNTKRVLVATVNGTGSLIGIKNLIFNISSPKAGYWYSSSFYLNTGSSISYTCSYSITSISNLWIKNDTIIIYPNKTAGYSGTNTAYSNYKYLSASNDPISFGISFTKPTVSCSLTSLIREAALPILTSTSENDAFITCTASTVNCAMNFQNPITNTWYYLAVSSNCPYTLNLNVPLIQTVNTIITTRYLSSSAFTASYFFNSSSLSNTVKLNNDLTPSFYEYLFDQANIGGTLKLLISQTGSRRQISNTNVYLKGCLMFNTLNDYENCLTGYKLSSIANINMNIAYPNSGRWFLALWRECLDTSTNTKVTCPVSLQATSATVQVSTEQCANNFCGDSGTCYVINVQGNLVSNCLCKNGYQGYACTDVRVAASSSYNLANGPGEVIFLTLSNLFFFLPILLALNRKWFVEALMYSYAMFFSIFYHACGQKTNAFCIFDFSGLQLADYIGAYSSFIITLLSIADLARDWQLFSYILSILLVTSIALYDRFDIVAFIIIIIIAALVTLGSWINVWYQTREVFPPKRDLLFYIPGLVLGITGVILFLAVTSDSAYWITHSFWHILISSSIIFFMPKSEKEPLFPFVYDLFNLESSSSKVSPTTSGVNRSGASAYY